MKILDNIVTKQNLMEQSEFTFDECMIKGVADVDRKLLAVDAELHSDLEELLLENGSSQESLWGINLYPDDDEEDFIEFDSIINIRPRQGNRSRGVEDIETQEKIRKVVSEWIQ